MRLHRGEGEIGRAALQLAWQIFNELNEQRFTLVHLLAKTLGVLELGAYETALREVQQVFQSTQMASDRVADPTLPTPYCALVDAYHAVLQPAAAWEPLETATTFVADKPLWIRLLPASRWCTHHVLLEQWQAAYTATLQAQALRDAAPTQLTWCDFARYHETEALLRAGNRPRAKADVERFAAHLGMNRRYRLVWLRMAALLARDGGDHTAALAHLAEAQDLATALVLPGEAWQIANEQSASAAHLGDAPQAQARRAAAEAGIARLAEDMTDPDLREHYVRAARARRPALS